MILFANMKTITRSTLSIILLMHVFVSQAQQQQAYHAIYSGIPWFDDKGNAVSAHGGCIVKDGGRYYLFGERHTDTSNAFAGFNCYSSADLYNWKFESVALPIQDTGNLSATYVGERAKVMKCPKTGEYVMYMHADTSSYKKQFVGYATSNTITGPYKFKGPLLFNDKPIKKWDMGTFQDGDGSGYILIHGGEVYKLGDDYKSVTEQVNKGMAQGFEAPTMFKKNDIYYFLGSNLTSWEKNDNYYYTAAFIKGPWTHRGLFCPAGSLTWNSQATFVFAIDGAKDTTFMFMGDRWSFPKQASAATYVWQPLEIAGNSISIPNYKDAWQINLATGSTSFAVPAKKVVDNTDKKRINYSGKWLDLTDTSTISSSDIKGDSFSVKFKGMQIGMYGLSRPDGGYARVTLRNNVGVLLFSAIVDLYCKYPATSLKYLSPLMDRGDYTLTVTVTGEHGNWTDKKKIIYGSTGNYVSLDKIVINE